MRDLHFLAQIHVNSPKSMGLRLALALVKRTREMHYPNLGSPLQAVRHRTASVLYVLTMFLRLFVLVSSFHNHNRLGLFKAIEDVPSLTAS